MRCALVPVGITKFTKLIERATEFKEVSKERSKPAEMLDFQQPKGYRNQTPPRVGQTSDYLPSPTK